MKKNNTAGLYTLMTFLKIIPTIVKNLEDLFLLTDNIPKLTETEKGACDQMLSIKECGKALNEMGNNKSPGCDGFTVEFYKFFWDKIKRLLHNSFVWSFQHKLLSLDQRMGVITLVPKKRQRLTTFKALAPYYPSSR